MMSSSPLLYQPTPLEEAYSLYLLQTVFSINSAETRFKISGRSAVQFLSRSGLDRTLLRTIWSTVDPDNTGSLHSIAQFHTILRLTALSQAGYMSNNSNCSDCSSMQQILLQTKSHTHLPLAQFSGLVIPAQLIMLQQQQPTFSSLSQGTTTDAALGDATTSSSNSMDDAFGNLVSSVQDSAPLPALQQQQQDTMGTTASSAAAGHGSNYDFNHNATTTTAPWSSHDTAVAATSTTDGSLSSFRRMGGLTSFEPTGFASSLPPQPQSHYPSGGVPATEADDSLFAAAVTSNTTTLTPSIATPSDVLFGGDLQQTTTTTTTTTATVATGNPNSTPITLGGNWDALDALANDIQDAPLPSLSSQPPPAATTITTANNNTDDDNFGDFEGGDDVADDVAVSSKESLMPVAPHNNVFGSDDLFATATTSASTTIAATTTAPPLQQSKADDTVISFPPQHNGGTDVDDDVFGGFTYSTTTSAAVDTSINNNNKQQQPQIPEVSQDDDDEFGDFTGTANDNMQLQQEQDDEFGDFTGTAAATTTTASVHQAAESAPTSLWGAFDALVGEVQDAPLPSLQTFNGADAAANDHPMPPTHDDDFGGFVGTQNDDQITKEPSRDSSNDALFGDAFEAAAPTLQATVAVDDGTAPPPPQTTSTIDNTASGWGALDALAADTQNAPIPTLGSFELQHQQQAPAPTNNDAAVGNDDDDDFGDFVGNDAVAEESKDAIGTPDPSASAADPQRVHTEQSPRGWDALDALGGTEDAPLPSLASLSFDQPVAQEEAVESLEEQAADVDISDSFGDFVSGESHDEDDRQETAKDAVVSNLAAEGDKQDEEKNPADEEISDSFGDFVSGEGHDEDARQETTKNVAVPILAVDGDNEVFPAVSEVKNAADEEISDSFGDFVGGDALCEGGKEDGVRIARDASLPSSAVKRDKEMAFAVPEEKNVVDDKDISDGFGDFVGGGIDENLSKEGADGESIKPSEGTVPAASSGVTPSPFDLLGPAEDKPLPSFNKTVDMGRVDSTYYSAELKSTSTADSEDFGGFEDAVESLGAGISSQVSTMEAKSIEEVSDDPSAIKTAESSNDDPFSAFNSVDAPPVELPPPLPQPSTSVDANLLHAPDDHEKEDDDFGDFSGFQGPISEEAAANISILQESNGIEAVSADDFGDFAEGTPATKATDNDDFGDFEAVNLEDVPRNDAPVEPSVAASIEESFGDFASFGNFGSVSPDETGVDVPEKKDSGGDGAGNDWDAFHEPASNQPNPTIEVASERDQIVSLSLQLPEALRRKSGSSGDYVDFGDCFDGNIGTEVPLTEDRKNRVQRSIQLLELLSSSHTKLASTYWAQCFAVVQDELKKGVALLQEADGLPKKDKEYASKHLEMYVDGLGEIVRVARSITATIGDLLMLESSALLTIDTLSSSWCSLALLNDALEVENQWKDITELRSKLSLTSRRSIESLVDIRSYQMRQSPLDLCHFTLQVLSTQQEKSSTKSAVKWEGRPFMACAANFLGNRCAFYVIS